MICIGPEIYRLVEEHYERFEQVYPERYEDRYGFFRPVIRARVVEAEAEAPRAMAEAFRSGNLGIMDYYKMKNVQADTGMRDAIARPERDDTDVHRGK